MNTYRNPSLFGIGTTMAVKRLFDIVGSLFLLIVFSPVFVVAAVVSAVSTKSTPLFVQLRMGRNNKPFRVLKIRTMQAVAPDNVATKELVNPDQFITRAGKVMRRLSIDELPQLLNILVGQMSFVGPRPVVATETHLIEMRTRSGACSVRPGLTGIAQINGRDWVSDREKARMDAFYANNVSLMLDFRLLVQTVLYVLRAQDIHDGATHVHEEKIERSA